MKLQLLFTVAVLATAATALPLKYKRSEPLRLATVSTHTAKPPAPPKDPWEPLRSLLEGWLYTENYGVSVGTAEDGVVFSYTAGNMTMHTPVETLSTSKWPSAMMIAGLVNDGTIASLDDKASKYLKWWTTDPKDKRSRVTLRTLLSFTSGFGSGHPGENESVNAQRLYRQQGMELGSSPDAPPSPSDCVYNPRDDINACAKAIYSTVSMIGEPGTVYSYNSFHLQLAGAVAVSASGLTIQQVLDKYLYKAFGMNETKCEGTNPSLAVCFTTTGHDYGNFLAGLLDYSALSKPIVDASEQDYTPFMADYYTLYGDYGFGHFLFCFDSVAGFTAECKAAQVHCDPGGFGYYPLIDRNHKYWMQIVAYENFGFYGRSGIPEYLGSLIKPIVDAIIAGEEGVAFTTQHHTPAFNAMSLVDLNYIQNCFVNPKSCL